MVFLGCWEILFFRNVGEILGENLDLYINRMGVGIKEEFRKSGCFNLGNLKVYRVEVVFEDDKF